MSFHSRPPLAKDDYIAFSPSADLIKTAVRNRVASTHCSSELCEKVICVGVFFDGTDNHMDRDRPKGAHTNVVRLQDAFPKMESDGYFRHYAPGVATQFSDVGDTDTKAKPQDFAGSPLGGPCGNKGAHRIIWGVMQVFNDIHFTVAGGAPLFDNEEITKLGDATSDFVYGTLQPDLIPIQLGNKLRILNSRLKKLDGKNKVKKVNLSVFGFSRGAAQARTFCTWLGMICEYKNGGYVLKDSEIEVNLQFLGIFDTVASVGSADLFNANVLYSSGGIETLRGHNGWARSEWLRVDGQFVKKTLHLVAGHETRVCFPVDLIRYPNGNYPSNSEEYIYPGVHSSVGGGYPDGGLGCFYDVAKIACIHMYSEAVKAGVPFNTSVSGEDWEVRPDAIRLFNYYVNKVTPAEKSRHP